MTSNEIRKRFLTFFEKRGHAVIPSASLVPENDPSVLFNTAGMQPLVPYLLGEKHPKGNRLVDAQKCVRTVDIDEIGDNTHATFFEMLGNWSLGDPEAPDGIGEKGYFKKEAIEWSFTFLTSKEEGLGLDPDRLYVTLFKGDDDAPKDTESLEIWKGFIPENRVFFKDKSSNWWSPGENGPCGPDTEMFYDVTEDGLGDLTEREFDEADDGQDVVEIWNNVFMEYEKKDGKVIGKLSQKNVDTGSGLERIVMVVNKEKSIFETDLLKPLLEQIRLLSDGEIENARASRIIADHIRTSVFLIADGVTPSNKDQGYVLRRLIRRSIRLADTLAMPEGSLPSLVSTVISIYKGHYKRIEEQSTEIAEKIQTEEEKFRKTLKDGLKKFEKMIKNGISAEEAFDLYQSYGFPIDLTKELAKENGTEIDEKGFEEAFEKHQEKSRKGSEQKFKGGLADHSEMSVKYHTATHLLHQALRDVLGEHVYQKGSNITPERLRFDFSHGEKMTDEEKKRVEDIINEKIAEALPMTYEDIPLGEAKKRGAIGLFGEKYGDTVRVYQIGEGEGMYSLEFCGGPHVKNTSELGHFSIKKEESCSAGVRRIKAILE